MAQPKTHTAGWGVTMADGQELWDAEPVFHSSPPSFLDFFRLFFYPKKFVLYRAIRRHIRTVKKRYEHVEGGERYIPRILDLGCGTGAAVIDLKKMFGRSVDVVGLDVVRLQIEIGERKLREHGVWSKLLWYDGSRLPFSDNTFDVVYSSDVLGHVPDVPAWLGELFRVLKDDGLLALFAESKLGRHAVIRNHLLRHGVNTDPHAAFHISLFSKETIVEFLETAGCEIERIYGTVWAKFFVHPDELRPALAAHKGLWGWKAANWLLFALKRLTHPVSTAAAELYSLIEMYAIGRWVESQGYVIVGKKRMRKD